MSELELPLLTRLWFAWACFFRVIFDGRFAAQVWKTRSTELTSALPLPEKALPEPPQAPVSTARAPSPSAPSSTAPSDVTSALQLLSLFQREGRLIDFLEQDITSFTDADVGTAARVVHEGCRKALRSHAKLSPVRSEAEGAHVILDAGFSPAEVKLTGNVHGSAPYRGVIAHCGWRAESLTLPTPVHGHDAMVIAPAEVEL